jgi:nitroreductase
MRMEFFEVVERRASVRAFEPVETAEDDLLRIVEAGRRAPSGRNRQPCQFVLITDKPTIERLGAVQACIGQASAAVAVLVDDQLTEYWKEDAAAAIENMLLAVAALGYASVWVEGYVLRNEAMVKETLGVPDKLRAIAVLPIGKPAAEPKQAAKKPLSEVLHRNRYGG